MTSNQTICDLCPAGVASERLHESGFSTLSVQGRARSLIQPLAGPGATCLDLCPSCAKELADWLCRRKVSSNAPVTQIPAVAEAVSDAPAAELDE